MARLTEFDFTGFPERTAEMNRLWNECHAAVRAYSGDRADPASERRRREAAALWKEYSGWPSGGFYLFEDTDFPAALAAGYPGAAERPFPALNSIRTAIAAVISGKNCCGG